MSFELRYYQEDAVVSVFDYWNRETGNPLVVLPTGSGKSVVLGEFCRRACTIYPETRMLVLSHVKELLAQNLITISRLWENAPVSLYSAGLNSKDLTGQVVIAGIQSIYKHAQRVGFIDLVLIDEAHLLTPDEAGMYRKFLAGLLEINPYLKVLGLTATPFRLDRGLLYGQKDSLFSGVAFEQPLTKLVDEGYLAPLTCKDTDEKLSVEGVGKRGGEFITEQLADNIDRPELTEAIVTETVARAGERGSWLVFGCTVDHATHLRDAFRAHGITAALVTGDTAPGERAEIFTRFKAGQITALCGVNVFTTGFDAPGVDLIVFARPTMSKGLLVQMAGRGMRLAEGKEDCLILDYAGNIPRHGPIDLITGDLKEKTGTGEAPVKVCPECRTYCYTAVKICPECGYAFPPPERILHYRPAAAPALARDLVGQWLEIDGVEYHRHSKLGSPDSLKVTYHCGLLQYREWICLEHQGYPREKAGRWWSRRMPGAPVPPTVGLALSLVRNLPRPSAIMVKPQGRYFDIVNYRF